MARWQDDLQFYSMHFMPYPHLPPDHKKYDSLWVDFSNKFYDPQKGHDLYQRYIGELVLADELGYDALVVNEHHNTVYSMMPSCSIIAAALIPQTKNARICCFGTPITLEYPNRLAEEYAMLDVMSGGRLEIAFPLGTGMEYWANPINPTTARARFRESIDIMLQAWTQDGPTTYDGEFYSYRYLNVWPKPMQKPHPKIAIVGTGSPETIEFAAQRGWGYASVFVPRAQQVKTFRAMREMSAKYGHEMTPDKALVNTIVYVAETDEQAQREAMEHIRFYFMDALRTTPRYLAPPGYISLDQFRIRASAPNLHGGFDWGELTANWRVAVGTPQRVAESIAQWCEEADSSRVILNHHLGDMPHWKVVKNMTLFAEEVVPRLRTKRASPTSAKTAVAQGGR
jgi:alkanesulfonate monooxygenase SsuD/methylene tetrahydromethanopterin reductase-like flavin-dependent oxidoreductase (luciferase family)